MIAFSPDPETLLVLEQAGFPKKEIDAALSDYSDLMVQYPDLVKPSTKDFSLFLKTKFRKTASLVSRNMTGKDIWVPGISEIKKLEEEGYWREIISSALIDHLASRRTWENAISKFAIFRSYLRERLPLDRVTVDNWYPCPYLVSLVKIDHQIEEGSYGVFWDHFKNLICHRQIEGRFIPRYFYNFVKKNKDQILSKTKHASNGSVSMLDRQNIRRMSSPR